MRCFQRTWPSAPNSQTWSSVPSANWPRGAAMSTLRAVSSSPSGRRRPLKPVPRRFSQPSSAKPAASVDGLRSPPPAASSNGRITRVARSNSVRAWRKPNQKASRRPSAETPRLRANPLKLASGDTCRRCTCAAPSTMPQAGSAETYSTRCPGSVCRPSTEAAATGRSANCCQLARGHTRSCHWSPSRWVPPPQSSLPSGLQARLEKALAPSAAGAGVPAT